MGAGESVVSTAKLVVDVPVVAAKFLGKSAHSLATWEDKLGIGKTITSTSEVVKAFCRETKYAWEHPEEYRARIARAQALQKELDTAERALNADSYHLGDARKLGYHSDEVYQFVFCGAVVKGGAKLAKGGVKVVKAAAKAAKASQTVTQAGKAAKGAAQAAKASGKVAKSTEGAASVVRGVRRSAKLLPQFSQETIQKTANKILQQKGDHIFYNKLHPKPYLHEITKKIGGRRNFFIKVIGNLNGKLPSSGFFEQTVTIYDQQLTVRGFVKDGMPIINTIFK